MKGGMAMRRTAMFALLFFLAFVLAGCDGAGPDPETTDATLSVSETTSIDATILSTTTGPYIVGERLPLSVVLSSGESSVSMYPLFISSHQYEESMMCWIYADGAGAFGYDLSDYLELMPVLQVTGSLGIETGVSTTWGGATLFGTDGTSLGVFDPENPQATTSSCVLRLYVSQYPRTVGGEQEYFHYYCFTLLVFAPDD
jgi:hypothetical protein